jgi:hypothetical protein
VIRGDSLEKNSIFRFGKKGRIPLARVKRLGISLKLGATIFIWLRVGLDWPSFTIAELCVPCWWPRGEREEVAAGRLPLGAAHYSCWPFPSSFTKAACSFLCVLRGR